jgi:hypothetical protein
MARAFIFLLIMGVLFASLYFGAFKIGTWPEKMFSGTVNACMVGWDKLNNLWNDSDTGKSLDDLVNRLTDQGKTKIDEWLAAKGLNQYGDKPDTVYAGGTPAFNEQTGQNVDKYLLILQKFPQLVQELDLGKYLQQAK